MKIFQIVILKKAFGQHLYRWFNNVQIKKTLYYAVWFKSEYLQQTVINKNITYSMHYGRINIEYLNRKSFVIREVQIFEFTGLQFIFQQLLQTEYQQIQHMAPSIKQIRIILAFSNIQKEPIMIRSKQSRLLNFHIINKDKKIKKQNTTQSVTLFCLVQIEKARPQLTAHMYCKKICDPLCQRIHKC
ncbi:unnamed protein product [Paramecium octaurelia]|uniref:Uncharacterized protein n=1 Tax=Paramecium octaurelia TaxID=43137 RepID=A0A8S1YRQ1_PAROT|nr:unnamed protein product [Paramecium octaurelia]